MKGWFFCTLGNCLFRMNGGLDGLDKDNWLHRALIWAWATSWHAEEKAAGRVPHRPGGE